MWSKYSHWILRIHFKMTVNRPFNNMWIGRGGHKNGRSEVPMLLHLIYSCGVGPNRMGTDQSKGQWMNRINKFDQFLPAFLLSKRRVSVFQLAEACIKLWELWYDNKCLGMGFELAQESYQYSTPIKYLQQFKFIYFTFIVYTMWFFRY